MSKAVTETTSEQLVKKRNAIQAERRTNEKQLYDEIEQQKKDAITNGDAETLLELRKTENELETKLIKISVEERKLNHEVCMANRNVCLEGIEKIEPEIETKKIELAQFKIDTQKKIEADEAEIEKMEAERISLYNGAGGWANEDIRSLEGYKRAMNVLARVRA